MRDPYSVLGVTKSASKAEIKSAFRKLAKKYHPDQNADDPNAKERFSEANQAYEILSDKEKRAQFDRGEIDAEGKPKFYGGGPEPAALKAFQDFAIRVNAVASVLSRSFTAIPELVAAAALTIF